MKKFYHICTIVTQEGIHTLCGMNIGQHTVWSEDNIADFFREWHGRQEPCKGDSGVFWEYNQNCEACATHPDLPLLLLAAI